MQDQFQQSSPQQAQHEEDAGTREEGTADGVYQEVDGDDDTLQTLADTFKGKLRLLSGSLESIGRKASGLNNEIGIADSNSAEFASRLHQAEQTISRLRAERELGSMREELLQQQVYRLETMLES
ncbi:hypothetical protein DUNSADRAFT_1885, partial [Dunaliella salina]